MRTPARFTGVDIDADAIAWSREHLKFADFRAIATLPPMDLPDASFDAAYSFSVFTHLPLEAQRAWLDRRAARVLKPGALAALTFHGRRAIERWLDGTAPSTTPSAERLRGDLVKFADEGYLFYEFGRMDSPHASNEEHWKKLDRALYGNTFLTRSFVEREWTRHFEARRAAPGARRLAGLRRAAPAFSAQRARSLLQGSSVDMSITAGPSKRFSESTARNTQGSLKSL